MSSVAIADAQLTIPNYQVLGVRVDAVQIPDAIKVLESWIEERGPARYVAVTGMHGVSVSREDAEFASILGDAGLVVADGMPLVWLGRCGLRPADRQRASRQVYFREVCFRPV